MAFNFLKRIFGTKKGAVKPVSDNAPSSIDTDIPSDIQNAGNSGETVGEAAGEGTRGKLMRPKFTKEETLALGTMALSFIVVNGQPDPNAEIVVISELEGFTVDDVKQMYTNLMKDQARHAMILHKSCLIDPFRKMYATGFLAKAIQSRADGGNAPLVVEGWKKVVKNIFGLAGEGTQSIEAGAKMYDEFEHPEIDPDTFFLIISWLSQVNYK